MYVYVYKVEVDITVVDVYVCVVEVDVYVVDAYVIAVDVGVWLWFLSKQLQIIG